MYYLFTTSMCLNDCKVCAVADVPGLSFEHIGRTPEQRKGLDNFVQSLENESIYLSGGDPLLNEHVLDSLERLHKSRKTIILNPISFLTFELSIPASRITDKLYEALKREKQIHGLNEHSRRIIGYLNNFNGINLSAGNLQSPRANLMHQALEFYHAYVEPNLRKDIEVEEFPINAKFSGDAIVSTEDNFGCVGRFRELISQGKIKSPLLRNPGTVSTKKDCTPRFNSIYFKPGKQSKGAKMVYLLCCHAGLNPYASHESQMSLESMGDMKPNEIKGKMYEEISKLEKTALYRILNNDLARNVPLSYMSAAEDLLSNGKRLKILDYAYTMRRDGNCSACEACYTVSILLHKNGIKPQEWRDYLEKRYPAQV